MPHLHTAQASNVVKERIRRLRTEDLVTRLREKLETVPVGNARAGCDKNLIGWDIQGLVILGDGFTGRTLAQ